MVHQTSAAVSHEIRGPIEAIQNLQYLIRTSSGISSEIAGLTRATADEAARLLSISESALSFIRQGKNREPIDICAALESVRFVLDPLIRKKGIEFNVKVQGDCIVQAYTGETRQVLLNIVRNACEAISQPGAHVTVAIKGESEGVEVVVVDEGIGIAPAIIVQDLQLWRHHQRRGGQRDGSLDGETHPHQVWWRCGGRFWSRQRHPLQIVVAADAARESVNSRS